jgi:hypothetical protein
VQQINAAIGRGLLLADVGLLVGARPQVAGDEVDAARQVHRDRRGHGFRLPQNREDVDVQLRDGLARQLFAHQAEEPDQKQAVDGAEKTVLQHEVYRGVDAGHRRRAARGRLAVEAGEQNAPGRENADRHAVEPEREHHREQLPAEEQHPRERHQVAGDHQQRRGTLPPRLILAHDPPCCQKGG